MAEAVGRQGGPRRIITARRSLAKALSYRAVIVLLDFAAIYLITGEFRVALGFMVLSNIYTTAAYWLHERAWARIKWGTAAGG